MLAIWGVADDSHVVGIKEDLDKLEDLIPATVLDMEHPVDSVLDSDTFSGVLEGLVDNVVKEQVEESWSKDASLSDTVVDTEWFGSLTVGFDSASGVGV